MSAERPEWIRGSVCATCLSQDRALRPVSIEMILGCYDLTLSERDRVCWECHHFVIKMAAFKNKAQRAQARLADWLHGKLSKIDSLSTLGISTGLSLHFPQPAQGSEHSPEKKPRISQEIPKKQVSKKVSGNPKNSWEQAFVASDIFKEKTIEVKQEREAISDEILGDEVGGDDDEKEEKICIELVKQEVESDEVIGDETTCDTAGDGSMSDDDKVASHKVLNKKPTKRKATVVQNNELNMSVSFYTEEKMTETEMWDWRERKKKNNYYLSSVPIFRCEKCIEPFDSDFGHRGHMKKHSEASGLISCYICEQRCHREKAMAQHMQMHFRLLTCQLCGHEWDNVNVMREHGEYKHNVPITQWQCELCRKEFPSRKTLSDHHGTHAYSVCADCGKLVHCRQMAQHMQNHCTGRCSKPLVLSVPCDVCGKRLRGGKAALQSHMRTHEELDPAAYCVPCGKQFARMSLYLTHLKNTLRHSAEQDLKYKCDVCGKAFHRKARIRHHILYQHGPKLPCQTCGKEFQNKSLLRRHARAHAGAPARDSVCEHCGKAFTSKATLRCHLNTHTGARPYACRLCAATFGHKSALYLHGRYKHKIKKKSEQSST